MALYTYGFIFRFLWLSIG
ncbi:hypothetical protein LINGRAHAP2_LOCUS10466 [Linum grandiflorum]